MSEHADIVIVGAGLVGASIARALVRAGMSPIILDERKEPAAPPATRIEVDGAALLSPGTSRVSSITPGSREFLANLGAWQRIDPAEICDFEGMEVWDERGTGTLSLPATGSLVENARVEHALREDLNVRWESSVVDLDDMGEGCEIELSGGDVITTDLVVGADGQGSVVASTAGLRTMGWKYEQHAVVCFALTSEPHGGIARQCFTSEGPLAYLPMAQPNLVAIVWSSTRSKVRMDHDDAAFCESLTRAFDGVGGDVTAVSRRVSFPLSQRHAARYVSEGVALVGDAAHTIHPLAGQGANLGLQDARTLSQVVANARLEGVSPGDLSVLRRYQQIRQPHNVAVAGVMEAFARLFGEARPGVAWLRNTGMRFVNENDWLKQQIVQIASQ